jgi:hypothetical protein
MTFSDSFRFFLSIPLVLAGVGSIAFLFLYVIHQTSPRRRALSAGGGTLVLCLSIDLGLLLWTDFATFLGFFIFAMAVVFGTVGLTYLHHVSTKVMSETIRNGLLSSKADSVTNKADQDIGTPEDDSDLDS